MHDFKSLYLTVIICATLVNTQTDTQTDNFLPVILVAQPPFLLHYFTHINITAWLGNIIETRKRRGLLLLLLLNIIIKYPVNGPSCRYNYDESSAQQMNKSIQSRLICNNERKYACNQHRQWTEIYLRSGCFE